MSTRLPSLNGLRAFEAAARHLSFTQAASELNVTQTAISHQIRRLEEELGLRLFVRQNRALELTPEARDYLPGVRAAFNDLRLATDRLLRKDDGHVLTVSTLASLAAKWLLPRLSAFQEAHPGIDVRITTSPSLVDFQRDNVDAAIRYGRGQWPGVRADWLMADELFPVCSPALVNGNKPLQCPQDLKDHVLLHTSNTNSDDWRLWLTAAGLPTDISKQPGVTFDLMFMTVQAAIDGIGVADGTDVLRPGRHRQGAACGSLQDRAAGRRRVLSGFARGARGFAETACTSGNGWSPPPRPPPRANPEPSAFLPTEPKICGWSRRAGMAHCPTTPIAGRREGIPHGRFETGGTRRCRNQPLPKRRRSNRASAPFCAPPAAISSSNSISSYSVFTRPISPRRSSRPKTRLPRCSTPSACSGWAR